MKKSDPLLLKSNGNVIMSEEQEIQSLKKKIEGYRKKYIKAKKYNGHLAYHYEVLYKKCSELKEINRLEQNNSKFWQGLYERILDTMLISSRNYCNLILKENENNLHPDSKSDIKYHKAELEKIINALFSLIKESNLLGSPSIGKFLSNRN